ncbi:hypothetical protein [Nonomuraea sp. SBT364]|uniref:hypothetical protein n=1 Tax=Nonomuraea sp. SBT364 TaxID=1580530 RepID=UPI00066B42AF|nr:hypothetical protein [Nonomuraea sp. SBT364]
MKKRRAWIALIAAVLLPVACGQPEFTYVRDRDGTTYFKVPASFARIDPAPLETVLSGDPPGSEAARLREQRVWSVAFDRSREPGVDHLFGSRDPFVYATVHRLTGEQRDTVSLDRLRDFILPVTEESRGAYLGRVLRSGRPPVLSGFERLSDEPIRLDGGARGVRVRYSYRIGATHQTFDQTAILDGSGATVSVMLIACRPTCYLERRAEFDEIANSFKLLRLPG